MPPPLSSWRPRVSRVRRWRPRARPGQHPLLAFDQRLSNRRPGPGVERASLSNNTPLSIRHNVVDPGRTGTAPRPTSRSDVLQSKTLSTAPVRVTRSYRAGTTEELGEQRRKARSPGVQSGSRPPTVLLLSCCWPPPSRPAICDRVRGRAPDPSSHASLLPRRSHVTLPRSEPWTPHWGPGLLTTPL